MVDVIILLNLEIDGLQKHGGVRGEARFHPPPKKVII
jgi:hypothetical protein